MRKYVYFAIGAVLLAVGVGCTSDSSEVSNEAVLEQDTEACSTPVAPSRQPSEETPEGTPHLQSPEEAEASDLQLVAESRGWTIEEAAADRRAADAVGEVAGQIAVNRPEIFIGSALSPEPGGTPRLYIKGPADDYVRDLVASAPLPIEVVDNQPYSREEMDQRQTRVVNALMAMGFESISASSDMKSEGLVEVAVTRKTGLPDDPDEILAGIPADLRETVTLTVSDCPVSGYD